MSERIAILCPADFVRLRDVMHGLVRDERGPILPASQREALTMATGIPMSEWPQGNWTTQVVVDWTIGETPAPGSPQWHESVVRLASRDSSGGRGVSDRSSQVRVNAERDPNYAPFCLPCSGLRRMRKVEPFYWRCACGAEHDERTPDDAPSYNRNNRSTHG